MSSDESQLFSECAKLLKLAHGSSNIVVQVNADPKALNCTVTLADEKALEIVNILDDIISKKNKLHHVDNEVYEKAKNALQSIDHSTDRLARIGVKTCEVCSEMVDGDYVEHLK